MPFRQWSSTQFHYSCLCTRAGNGHHVFGIFGTGNWGPIPPIRGIGGIPVEPVGFVMMNVKVSCVQGYDEDQVAIVMNDPDMSECLVILGTPTIYRVMEVIKESEISKLAAPWASS